MNLYLLRHASAGIRRSNPLLDTKRPLDREGKQFCIQLGQVLGLLKVQFDLIISSPLKRSMQTAALVGTETGYEAKILTSPALAPGGTLADFRRLIDEASSRDNVLVVGHNPSLSSFLGSMIVMEPRSTGGLRGIRDSGANGVGKAAPAQHRAAGQSTAGQIAASQSTASHGSAGQGSASPSAASAGAAVRLRKGSLARINCDVQPASLQWLLDPRVVRALYASSATSSRRKTSRK